MYICIYMYKMSLYTRGYFHIIGIIHFISLVFYLFIFFHFYFFLFVSIYSFSLRLVDFYRSSRYLRIASFSQAVFSVRDQYSCENTELTKNKRLNP